MATLPTNMEPTDVEPGVSENEPLELDEIDFYSQSSKMQELFEKGEAIPASALPSQHPLWLVIGILRGLARAKPAKAEAGITGESLRRLENSIQKMLKEKPPEEKKSNQLPLYCCIGVTICCLLLFCVLLLRPSPSLDPYAQLTEEFRTCTGPHVRRLKDGSCTLNIELDGNILRVPSWKVQTP